MTIESQTAQLFIKHSGRILPIATPLRDDSHQPAMPSLGHSEALLLMTLLEELIPLEMEPSLTFGPVCLRYTSKRGNLNPRSWCDFLKFFKFFFLNMS